MFPIASLTEKGGEWVIVVDLAGLDTKGAIHLDAMFQTEELPAGITNLNSRLTHVDWYALPLWGEYESRSESPRP